MVLVYIKYYKQNINFLLFYKMTKFVLNIKLKINKYVFIKLWSSLIFSLKYSNLIHYICSCSYKFDQNYIDREASIKKTPAYYVSNQIFIANFIICPVQIIHVSISAILKIVDDKAIWITWIYLLEVFSDVYKINISFFFFLLLFFFAYFILSAFIFLFNFLLNYFAFFLICYFIL